MTSTEAGVYRPEHFIERAIERGGRWELSVSLPWFRSLPLEALDTVSVDGAEIDASQIVLTARGERRPLADWRGSGRWWFLSERIQLAFDRPVVTLIAVELRIPYLLRAGKPAVHCARQQIDVDRAS